MTLHLLPSAVGVMEQYLPHIMRRRRLSPFQRQLLYRAAERAGRERVGPRMIIHSNTLRWQRIAGMPDAR